MIYRQCWASIREIALSDNDTLMHEIFLAIAIHRYSERYLSYNDACNYRVLTGNCGKVMGYNTDVYQVI